MPGAENGDQFGARILLAEKERELAELASGAKTSFLAAMSHEIRTPTGAIIGFAEVLLEQGGFDDDARRQIGLIQKAGQVLLAVVNNILDFSTLEAGKIVIHPHPFSVSSLVKNMSSIVRTSAENKGLRFVTIIESKKSDWFSGDASRIGQVLLNLLHNAVKYTQEGSIVVRVVVENEAVNPPVLRFSVVDSGTGIPKDRQNNLFKLFSQLDRPNRPMTGATGLGLAICKQLVERMGGDLGVDSAEGLGATFWFRLPLPRSDQIIQPEKVTGDAAAARILLVEDVAMSQEIATTHLRRAGHVVHVANNGSEAVAAARDGVYDLILMDIQMPVLDGLRATECIRQLPGPRSKVPIVATTANVMPAQIAACRSAGMNDHLAKPYSRKQLNEIVARWARGYVVPADAPTVTHGAV